MLRRSLATKDYDFSNLLNRDAPINRGLISWWLEGPWSRARDNILVDLTLRAHGTISGTVYTGYGQQRQGGISDFFPNGYSSGLVTAPCPSIPSQISMGCWLKSYDLPSSGVRFIVGKVDSASYPGDVWLEHGTTEGSASWAVGGATWTGAWVTTTEYNHNFVTHDGSTVRTYVNGTLYSSQASSYSNSYRTIRWVNGWAFDYVGFIDDVRLYDRALTDAEVQQVYRDSLDGYPSTLNRSGPSIFLFSGSALNNYSLSASPGSFALTGTAAGLTTTRKLTGSPGLFALTGVAANVTTARKVTASPGSFALTGGAAGLTATKKITASPGSFALTGGWADVWPTRKIIADPGSFSFTGIAATLTKTTVGSFSLTANPGSFSLTGIAAGLTTTRNLTASSGSFSLTGIASGLYQGHKLTASPGSFALTGTAATLTKTTAGTYSLVASPGSFALTGVATTFGRTYQIAAAPGAFTLTGRAATLTWSGSTPIPTHIVTTVTVLGGLPDPSYASVTPL